MVDRGEVVIMEDRRKFNILTHVTEIFTGRQSRKVAFGVWVFWMANIFLKIEIITADIWWKCVLLAGGLIGFGTILDSVLEKIGDRIAIAAVEKANMVVSKTNVTVTSESTPS